MLTNKGYIQTLNTKATNSPNTSKFVVSELSNFESHVEKSSLSIKYVISGEENYTVDQKTFTVRSNQFLIVNSNDQVNVNVNTKQLTKGICLFPSQALFDEVSYYQLNSTETLLDFPQVNKMKIAFIQSIFSTISNSTGKFIHQSIPTILHAHQHNLEIDYHSFFTELVEKLIYDQFKLTKQIQQLSSSKKQTKEELFRRLSIVKDYIHDNYTEKLEIGHLSEIACLSKYHFLRSFKELYKNSPYQYLLQLKLNKALELKNNNYSYAEITELIGFSDAKNLRKSLQKNSNRF